MLTVTQANAGAEIPARPASRFQSGVTLNLLGAVFNQGSTFVFNVIAANLLGREAFGKYGFLASTLVTLSQVSQLAFGFTATKYVAEFRSNDKHKAGQIIGSILAIVTSVAVAVGFGLFLSAPQLAAAVFRAPELTVDLRLGCGIVLFNVLMGLFMGVLAGLEAYRALSRALMAYGVIYLAVCSLMTFGFGLEGAFTGLLVSGAVGCWLLGQVVVRECRKQSIRIQAAYFPELRSILLHFALPAAISGLTFLPALWIGNAVLVRGRDGYGQMALFSAAFMLMNAVLFVPNNTHVVGWSILNHHKGVGQLAGYRRTFAWNLAFIGTAAVAGSLAIGLTGPELLRVFGRDFGAGSTVLRILLSAAIPQALTLAILQHLQSQERVWFSFLAVILPRDVLLVGLGLILTPRHGAIGLASGYAIAWTVALLIVISITVKAGVQTAAITTA